MNLSYLPIRAHTYVIDLYEKPSEVYLNLLTTTVNNTDLVRFVQLLCCYYIRLFWPGPGHSSCRCLVHSTWTRFLCVKVLFSGEFSVFVSYVWHLEFSELIDLIGGLHDSTSDCKIGILHRKSYLYQLFSKVSSSYLNMYTLTTRWK